MRDARVKAVVPVDKYDFGGVNISRNKPFKTLYLLHGVFGNESGWDKESRVNRWATEMSARI